MSLWDTDGGEKILSMPAHLSDVTALQFKADNTAIGSGDANGILKIWDLREGRLQRNFDGHRLKVNSVGFHPNNETSICATGSAEGRTKLWDIRRKGFYTTFGIKGGAPVNIVQFSPDGRLCAIGDEDGLKIWDLVDTKAWGSNQCSAVTHERFSFRDPILKDPVLSLSLLKCKSIQFHPREWLLAATSYSHGLAKVHFIDLETMREESTVKTGDQEIRSISFHPEKPVLFAAADDRVDVVGWSPNDIFDHMPCSEAGKIVAGISDESRLLVMRDSDRCSGTVSAVDLTQLRLTRPQTPLTASRKEVCYF